MTAEQVREHIPKSARTISRLASSGELDYSQKLPGPNGAYLFSQENIDAWLAKNAEPAS